MHLRRRRLAVSLLVCGLVAVVMSGCVWPDLEASSYAADAADSASAAEASVETAGLVARTIADGRAFSRYSVVILTEAESQADAISGAFSSVQPPDAPSDALRADLLTLLDEAVDLLAKMRIAARRGDFEEVVAVAADLPAVADRLARFTDRAEAAAG